MVSLPTSGKPTIHGWRCSGKHARIRLIVVDVMDLVTVTGGFSYITSTTISRILACFPLHRQPWIVGFPLVGSDTSKLSAALTGFGLEVEKAPDVLMPQRRYNNDDERERFHTMFADEEGLDVPNSPLNDWLCAELWVAYPGESAHKPRFDGLVEDKGSAAVFSKEALSAA